MDRRLLLPLLLLLLLLLLPLSPLEEAPLPGCPSDRFQCRPGDFCFPLEWRCDGHPDCMDEEDERDCGTATPTEPNPDGASLTSPRSSALPTDSAAETSATSMPEGSVPLRSQGSLWILFVAVLLSILVAVTSIAVWALSKAKGRSDIFSLNKASREQLIPARNQASSCSFR